MDKKDKSRSSSKKRSDSAPKDKSGKDKEYFEEVEVPLIFKIIQVILPFFVLGGGTLATGNVFVGYWLFYFICCILFPIIVINCTPYYAQVWKRVKNTDYRPTNNIWKLLLAVCLGLMGFACNFSAGFFDKATERDNVTPETEEATWYKLAFYCKFQSFLRFGF